MDTDSSMPACKVTPCCGQDPCHYEPGMQVIRLGQEVAALRRKLDKAEQLRDEALEAETAIRTERAALRAERDDWRDKYVSMTERYERMRPYAEVVTRHLECEQHDCRCGIDIMPPFRAAQQEKTDA